MRNDFCSNYLEHSAKGTSWRKKGAKYLSRVWKNGRWVYEYKITGKGYLRDAQEAAANRKLYNKLAADKAKNLKSKQQAVKNTQKKISILKANNPNKGNFKQGYHDELMRARNEQRYKSNPTKATAAAYIDATINQGINRDRAERNEKYYDRTLTRENARLTRQTGNVKTAEKEYTAAKNLAEKYANEEVANKSLYDKSLAGKIDAGVKAIKDILSNFKTTETVTITSNLYPAGTKKVIKKK